MLPYLRAEVAEPGLTGRPTFGWAQVGNRMVHIDAAADRGSVGEHIGGVAQQQLFPQSRGDLIGIDWGVPGGQVDHRFQADVAPLTEQQPQPAEQYRADVFDAGNTTTGGERFGAQMYIDHRPRPGPLRPERR